MPHSEEEDTVRYYDKNAAAYFDETAHLDMSDLRRRFTDLLPEGARILDAGCGSGRDSRAFADQGFDVVAIDASAGMAAQASDQLGVDVRVMRFEVIEFAEEFDGIWASASLLHVPGAGLPTVLERFATALRPDGILYLSFRLGETEQWRGGRRFHNLTEQGLMHLMRGLNRFSILETWETGDVRETGNETGQGWLNCLARLVGLS
jgi:SAM-dependent methyltransferase